METAFGQALVASFGEVLFVFLQTLQDTPITRLHGQTDSLHIFDTGKPIPFSFPPMDQLLPYDLLTRRVQSFHALHHTTSSVSS